MRTRPARRLFVVLPLLLLVAAGGPAYRHVRQARLDDELVAAVNANDLARVNVLLDRGADANTRVTIPGGRALFIRYGHAPWQRALLAVHLMRPRPVVVPLVAEVPVATAAAEEQRWRVVAALVRRGARPDARGPAGLTVIGGAVQAGDRATVQRLLERGVDPDLADAVPPYRTPLGAATLSGDAAMVRLLLAAGANPTRRVAVPGKRHTVSLCDAAHTPALRRLLLQAEADWRRRHPPARARGTR